MKWIKRAVLPVALLCGCANESDNLDGQRALDEALPAAQEAPAAAAAPIDVAGASDEASAPASGPRLLAAVEGRPFQSLGAVATSAV